MKPFLGFQIHHGEPELRTKLRSYKSSLLSVDRTPGSVHRNNYTDHALARWYGISFRLRWFAGIWIFGETTHPTEIGPLP